MRLKAADLPSLSLRPVRSPQAFPSGKPAIPIASMRELADFLTGRPGLNRIGADFPLADALLSRGIKNVLVSRDATADGITARLCHLFGVRDPSGAADPGRALLWNVPAPLVNEGTVLFSVKPHDGSEVAGQLESGSTATITLRDVRSGLTDFGEDMVHFMELNGIHELEVLSDAAVPKFQRLGFGGAVYGDRLGMRGDVSTWNMTGVQIKESCGLMCFDCIVACPSGAIDALRSPQGKLQGGIRIDPTACKGCTLCEDACHAVTMFQVKKDE